MTAKRKRSSQTGQTRKTGKRAPSVASRARRRPQAGVPLLTTGRRVRYAVLGMGHIAQTAVLPAFAHAGENSELVALVSSDPSKLKALGRRHKVSRLLGYHDFEDILASHDIDAVYIALPNSLHADFAVRSLRAGVHVIVEKPMATTEDDCARMVEAASETQARLMVAYRLHFEEANLRAIELARSGKLGQLCSVTSSFGFQVRENDIRLARALGGGPLWDIGVYCINAARNLFADEPTEVFAFSSGLGGPDLRFTEVDAMAAATMRFGDDRLASFQVSFNQTDHSWFEIVGTEGRLRVEPSYEYAGELRHRLTIGGRTSERRFARRDQFAPELVYFSDCVLRGKQPEPSGAEGLADVRVIRALIESAEMRRPVLLEPFEKRDRPSVRQAIRKPPVREPQPIHAAAPAEG